MINSQNPFYKILVILNTILLIPLLALSYGNVCDSSADWYLRISSAFAMVAMIAAFYYVVMGYTKEHAWAYKAFLISYIGSALFSLYNSAQNSQNMLSVVVASLVFGLIIVIAVSKDLGKAKSFLVCGAIIVLCAVKLADTVVRHPGTWFGGTAFGSMLLIRYISQLLMGIMLTLMTAAKYVDKRARGSK